MYLNKKLKVYETGGGRRNHSRDEKRYMIAVGRPKKRN
jgi:hypothetical protein